MSTKRINILLFIYIAIGIIVLWYVFLLAFYFYGFIVPNQEDSALSKLGQLGDSFGMLNTLFSGLGLAALLYTLKQQQDIIEIGSHESNFKLIIEELRELKFNFKEFHFPVIKDKKGALAIFEIVGNNKWRYESAAGNGIPIYDNINEHNDLYELKLLLEDVNRIFFMLNNLKTNENQTALLLNDLKHLNKIFISSCVGIMQNAHGITDQNKNVATGTRIDILRKDIYLNIEGISNEIEIQFKNVMPYILQTIYTPATI